MRHRERGMTWRLGTNQIREERTWLITRKGHYFQYGSLVETQAPILSFCPYSGTAVEGIDPLTVECSASKVLWFHCNRGEKMLQFHLPVKQKEWNRWFLNFLPDLIVPRTVVLNNCKEILGVSMEGLGISVQYV